MAEGVTLGVAIGATLGAAWQSTIGKSVADLSTIGEQSKKIADLLKDIQNIERLPSDIQQTTKKLAAQEEVYIALQKASADAVKAGSKKANQRGQVHLLQP